MNPPDLHGVGSGIIAVAVLKWVIPFFVLMPQHGRRTRRSSDCFAPA